MLSPAAAAALRYFHATPPLLRHAAAADTPLSRAMRLRVIHFANFELS